jgi:hypothetical protein
MEIAEAGNVTVAAMDEIGQACAIPRVATVRSDRHFTARLAPGRGGTVLLDLVKCLHSGLRAIPLDGHYRDERYNRAVMQGCLSA